MVSTETALEAAADAIVALRRVEAWARERAGDEPGGQDVAALAGHARTWAVRVGVEVADALASETDREHAILGAGA